ncbi:hypothetical protein HDU97_004048 [Phlyctochytrium planicorne]|nr:hypothetical protein HDU97_004048 [Phlyctochytrium planicorne]
MKVLYTIRKGAVHSVQSTFTTEPPSVASSRSLRFPEFTKDVTLIDFVMECEEYLSKQFRGMVEKSQRKKILAKAIIKEFRSKCLEYDDEEFTYISFLHEVPHPSGSDPIAMVVNVHFHETSQPRVIVCSVAYTKPDGYTPEIKNLSWKCDAETPIDHVIASLRAALSEQIPQFNAMFQAQRKPA